jgi:hypothetical protein
MGDDTILAVNTILLQLFTLFSYMNDGFAFAAEALTGRFIGAKDEPSLRDAVKKCMIWCLVVAFFVAAAILRNEPLVADGREGINGLTISNAMHLSAWTGKTVTLPFDEEQYRDLLMEHVKTSRRKEGIESVFASTEGTYNS